MEAVLILLVPYVGIIKRGHRCVNLHGGTVARYPATCCICETLSVGEGEEEVALSSYLWGKARACLRKANGAS